MSSLVTQLNDGKVDATFFFSGLDATNSMDAVNVVSDAGYVIGSNGYNGAGNMQTFSQQTVISDICRAAVMIQSVTGDQPDQLLFRQTTYTDDLRAAAGACGIRDLVQPTYWIGADIVSSKEQLFQLLRRMPSGSILCVSLSGALSAEETLPAQALLAEIQLSSETPAPEAASVNAMTVASWVVEYMRSTDYTSLAASLAEENAGTAAEDLTRVYTIDRSVAFTFSGMGSNAELTYLLDTLGACKAKCVFFVTESDMSEHADQIRLILSYGHDLGMAVHPNASSTAAELCAGILYMREKLESDFGFENAVLVRQPRGAITDALREAVSASGSTFCQQTILASQDRDAANPEVSSIYAALFTDSTRILMRGDIVHFLLGFYTGGDTILGDLVRIINEQNNIYTLASLSDMLSDTEHTYVYPLPDDKILPERLNKIYPGQLEGSVISEIVHRYIGTTWLTAGMLPGFADTERSRLDRKGIVDNPGNSVFLTFDDWGTDANITKLLDVLREYDVKATFFVRTNNVHYNPNLLRAIAADGHDIACHTDSHYRLAIDETGKGTTFRSLTEAEVQELAADLVTSYDTLQHIVGDMVVDGRPALTLLFRPPTLAISKEGLQTVLDCGFTFSVSGSCSTQDYNAKNAKALASTLRINSRPGAILVMHMSDNSVYTADALDLFFSANERKAKSERVTFARLSDYLQPGYEFWTVEK